MFKLLFIFVMLLWPRFVLAEDYSCAYVVYGEPKISLVSREDNAFRITTPDTPDGLVFNILYESDSELVLGRMSFIRKHMSIWYLDKDSGKNRSITVPSPSFTGDTLFPEIIGNCMPKRL